VKRSVIRIILIVAVSGALGFLWNAFSGRGLALRANAYLEPGDQEIAVAEAKNRLDGGALFLDARPLPFYEMEHVPGAFPLPQDDFESAFAKVEPRLRQSFDVIVYCAGFGCEASHIVSRKLKERGIPATILSEGWPAWQEAGYPVTQGAQP
jgi:rhodanese-related sulfurtransferase